MDRRRIPRNKPIATVIKNYLDKKSGKVTESREEIRRRFFGLDWKDQKRIISAFLDAGKSDRDWAYSRLLDLWDNSFSLKISELWAKYHEFRCAWIIIRHFPLDYIKTNIDQFKEDRDYYLLPSAISSFTAWSSLLMQLENEMYSGHTISQRPQPTHMS